MNNINISLNTKHGRFNYRVGAIIIHDNHLLMVKNIVAHYYYSVGGRVMFGESSAEAVLREIVEETRVKMEIERLAFIHENFFLHKETGNEPFHEISFFYIVKPVEKLDVAALNGRSFEANGEPLCWLPLDQLSEYRLFPEFFKTELRNLTQDVGHFITRDETTFRVK